MTYSLAACTLSLIRITAISSQPTRAPEAPPETIAEARATFGSSECFAPTTRAEEEVRAWLHFANLQYTPRLAATLLQRFDRKPQAILEASDAELDETPGFAARHLVRLRDPVYAPTPRQLVWTERYGVQIVLFPEEGYPALLREIPDPPPLLFVRGTLSKTDAVSVGMVGSRHATPYGRNTAERLARELAGQGVTVVSGGAVGIDAAAHRGALNGGGRTIAFLGCGLDVDYPRENNALFTQVVAQGALISEFPLGAQPESWRFPARNRLISGMSLGTIVVEAPRQSGALITARYAVEHGRVVMTVPGNIDRPTSVGTNDLLKEGMTPVTETEDILRALDLVQVPARPEHQRSLDLLEEAVVSDPLAAPGERRSKPQGSLRPSASTEKESAEEVETAAPTAVLDNLSGNKRTLITCLTRTPRHIDAVSQETGLSITQAGVELTLLELDGLVRRLPGNNYIRTI